MDTQPPRRGDKVVEGHYQALGDPALDNLLTLVLNLSTEVWTLRDRLRLIHGSLDQLGVQVDEQIEARRNTEEQLAEMAADRDEFVARLFRSVVNIR